MEKTKGKNRFIVLEVLEKISIAFKSMVGSEGNIDEKLERKFEETLQYVSTQSSSKPESSNGIQRIRPEELRRKGEVISDQDKTKYTINKDTDEYINQDRCE